MFRNLALVLVGALAVVACGSTAETTALIAGTQDSELPTDEVRDVRVPCLEVPPGSDLNRLDVAAEIEAFRASIDWWVEVNNPAFRTLDADEAFFGGDYAFDVAAATTVRSSFADPNSTFAPPTGEVLIYQWDYDVAQLSSGTVVFGVSSVTAIRGPRVGEQRDEVRVALVQTPQASVQHITGCGYSLLPAIAAALDASGYRADLTATNQAFAALIGYPDTDSWDLPPVVQTDQILALLDSATEAPDATSITWVEQSPQLRSLADAPLDVTERLEPYTILIELPQVWRDASDIGLCTRIELGWNSCVALNAHIEGSETALVPLDGLREVGGDVELVLAPRTGFNTGEAQHIATIGTAQLESADGVHLRIQTNTAARAVLDGSTGDLVLTEIAD